MARQPTRDTGPEIRLRSALHRRGLRYRVHLCPIQGSRRRADVVFPAVKVAVFVDGCFWHGCPHHASWPAHNRKWWREKIEANRRRDRDTDRELRAAGWVIVRVWEHEDVDAAAEEIEETVRSLRLNGSLPEPAGEWRHPAAPG